MAAQHANEAHQISDERRTRWLESEGYRVIRFWNIDLTNIMTACLKTVYAALFGSRDVTP